MNANLYALFQSRFPEDPDAPFIETEDGRRLTYGGLETESARIARFLGGLGVGKGERVVVHVDKSPRALVLYLACLRLGAVYVPLNAAYTSSEIGFFLGDARPRVMVCRPSALDELRGAAERAGVARLATLDEEGEGSLWEGSRGLDPEPAVAEAGADDLAVILYTSGTTGRSKGAMLSHGNLSSNAVVLHRAWGFRRGDVLLHALPIFHTHGLFVATNCVLLNGTGMVFLPRFDADAVVRLLPRATLFMGVPTYYTRLLCHPALTPELCRHMRLFVTGSAPLLAETFNRFRERTGHTILERYGMTETGMLTSNPLEGERVAGSCGQALPGVELRIAGEHGAVLGPGEVGVIEVRGPNVFRSYWRLPEKTKAEFREDGFFITGDIGRLDAKGYLTIMGRAKDLVISGGINVYPKEVEDRIDAIEGVAESAVIGVPHADFGEGVVAIVTKAPKGGDLSADAIIQHLKGELADFKLPKRVVFVDELPRNAMGKIEKGVLRDRYKDSFGG